MFDDVILIYFVHACAQAQTERKAPHKFVLKQKIESTTKIREDDPDAAGRQIFRDTSISSMCHDDRTTASETGVKCRRDFLIAPW